jgi:hypothetical protein
MGQVAQGGVVSDFGAYILHTNRVDLLEKAQRSLLSVGAGNIRIIDNSGGFGNLYSAWENCGAERLECRVPLTAPQSFNWAYTHARRNDCRFVLTMHEDAEAEEGAALALVEMARMYTEQQRSWGVIFTNYDALAAYNLDMIYQKGLWWDPNFHHYYSDNDFFRRVKLAGYELLESNLPVKHLGSQTIHSDSQKLFMNSILFPMDGRYYSLKWGGEPGKETFFTPFNR